MSVPGTTPATQHYSVEFRQDEAGWWRGKCVCGWGGGAYPDVEDAADALMDHAYEQGYSGALRDAVAMTLEARRA